MLKTKNIYAENEPLCQPIYQTSVFQMPSYTEAVRCEKALHPTAYYSRWGNPTVSFLEDQLIAMTGYEKCLIFPSGMSAITMTFISLVKSGDYVFISNRLYGDTLKFFIEELPRFGAKIQFFDILQIDALFQQLSTIKNNRIFLYFETLSNPDLVLADLEKLAAVAKAFHAISICDATFTPPGNLKIPLPHYVDICIHSLTKYISGHFASSGGAILSSSQIINAIWHTQSLYGACMDPHAAWLISQGMKTLHVRIKEQNQSALSIANYLESHPEIQSVHYPFCKSNPQFSLAHRFFHGGGGVVSFSLKGGKDSAIQLLENVHLIGLYVSLGGVHSCIEHAQTMSHSMLTLEHQEAAQTDHVSADLIRLSVGIENVQDLIDDLNQALENSRASHSPACVL